MCGDNQKNCNEQGIEPKLFIKKKEEKRERTSQLKKNKMEKDEEESSGHLRKACKMT